MKKILFILCVLFGIMYAKERIVVLDPASVETIFMLGAGEQIVAMAKLQHSDIYPQDRTKNIPSVGTFSNPSVEKIISLKPSLVILSDYSLNLKQMLDNFKIKNINLKANSLNDIQDNIAILAKITNKEKEGKELLDNFNNQLAQIQAKPINKSAIYLYSNNPLMAFNNNSLIADILRLLGVNNVSPDSNVSRPIISEEYILKQNPDMMILGMNASRQNLSNFPLLKSTKALKQDCIIINNDTHELLRLSPKIIDRIEKFKKLLFKC
ncbi:ABC transporter substrate-binding protein [Campylobacter insulaenigrae]|uniref:ABC transporter substrate-binding protein n=1 Tax=Campylobacter insulaenigrae TaxID=260714 RepID=UPI002152A85C|nr:helical backbone metal receptor [Campylobacter insulaenigrae]MCR6571972.1 helical backbone metal receptor [Campylobacter insulaenigrae]MCR6581320.1 helical backbone metal receptor [Campylobacter insulaenigrae]